MDYKTDTRSAMIGEKKFTVTEKTPIFANDTERKFEIKRVSDGLYSIFAKYMGRS